MVIMIGSRALDSERSLLKPYIICEAGVNHEGSIEKARVMIEQAKEGGADAIKFQVYKANLIASKESPAYWDVSKEPTKTQYELFKKYDAFWRKEFEELASYSYEVGIDFLATPFDFESADFLEPLVKLYKVASADINNLPFLRYVAKKGKPMFISTGAASVSEIWSAIEAIKSEGNNQIALMHCILSYPTSFCDANLGMIADMRKKFPGFVIGYSDHTLPDKACEVLITAWLLGAQVIEKHFTYDKKLKGNDHYHSIDLDDLKKLNKTIDDLIEIIGDFEKHYIESEMKARNFARRSIVAVRKIPKGKTINSEDITTKRPGTGVPPELYDYVVGSVAARDINEDEIIRFGDFKQKP